MAGRDVTPGLMTFGWIPVNPDSAGAGTHEDAVKA
jgi:hypothetical protein